jgi:hypothetical protein
VARCARDVLSRDAPRETGCSRSAKLYTFDRLSSTQFDSAHQLIHGTQREEGVREQNNNKAGPDKC